MHSEPRGQQLPARTNVHCELQSFGWPTLPMLGGFACRKSTAPDGNLARVGQAPIRCGGKGVRVSTSSSSHPSPELRREVILKPNVVEVEVGRVSKSSIGRELPAQAEPSSKTLSRGRRKSGHGILLTLSTHTSGSIYPLPCSCSDRCSSPNLFIGPRGSEIGRPNPGLVL